jgi:Fe-S-cluster containining protein
MLDTATIPVTIAADNKCGKCTGSICCTYITHELKTPRTKAEFDYLLWQVSHDHVAVYRDNSAWYLMVSGKCSHLVEPGGLCGIYETRPQICRDHSNKHCDYDEQDLEYEDYFDNYEALLKYCKKRFKAWGRNGGPF